MKFVLIGGKENKEIQDNLIEKRIIESLDCKPRILFCPLATIEKEKAIFKFKKLLHDIDYDLDVLDLNNLDKFDELINTADIFYVGGGNCNHLVDVFKKNKLDIKLKNHLNDNIIYIGSSAGAMLVSVISMGDRDMYSDNFHNYNYKMVECLGILNISICPHFQNEDLIIYNDEVIKLDIDSFGIEEGSALVIDNDKFYVLKDQNKNMIYYYPNDSKKMIPLKAGVIYEKTSGFRS